MTAPERVHVRRVVVMWGLGAVVLAASLAGSVGYTRHVEDLDRERAEFATTVCRRQDQVIEVLRLVVSDERARLAFPDTPGGSGIFRSNHLIRQEIGRIFRSPCQEKGTAR